MFFSFFNQKSYSIEKTVFPEDSSPHLSKLPLSTCHPKPVLNCYKFVNEVLKIIVSSEVITERDYLWRNIQEKLPKNYWSDEIVPYYYFLIAKSLEKEPSLAKFWSLVNINDAQPGDILVYLGPDYEPDPLRRAPGRLTSSHIAFIDRVFGKSENGLRLRLMDCSARMKGRLLNLNGPLSVPCTPWAIAYSFLNLKPFTESKSQILLTSDDHPLENLRGEFVWEARFDGQWTKPLMFKILRFLL